ncbi:MAG: hypothetical protein V3T37_01810, partial [Syntrophobacteria bacterium]
GCARLRQAFTYGKVRLDLSEPVRSHIWRTLARFFLAQVCNVRVCKQTIFSQMPLSQAFSAQVPG